MNRRTVRGTVVAAIVAAVVAAFVVTADGPLTAPPLTSTDDVRRWLDQRDPLTAGFAVLRLVSMVATGYVGSISVLAWLARDRRGWCRVLNLVALPSLRPLVARAAGAGLASAVVVPGTALAAPGPPPAEAMVLLEDDTEADDTGTATMRVLPPEEPAEPVPTTTATTTTAAPATTTTRPPPAATTTSVITAVVEPNAPSPVPPPSVTPSSSYPAQLWVIEPGEHLWAVAEAHLTETWGRPPSDREVTRYWRTLVEHNRPHLPDPANPDLVFPGTVVELPPLA